VHLSDAQKDAPEIQSSIGSVRKIFRSDAAAGTHAMSVLVSLLVTFLVIILVLYLIGMLPIDGRAKQIARIIVIIIGVVSLLRYLQVF
jgi:hypothetical protein